MEKICNYNECTGCEACKNVCPSNCIEFAEDVYGELHPQIDNTRCINCKKCVKVCPSNSSNGFNYPINCYAGWRNNKKKRQFSASGGLASLFYEYVLAENGIVVGVYFDEDLNAVLGCIDNACDLEKLKGSKYTHAKLSPGLYFQILNYIKLGKKVLYIGTPCQIAAIKSYLNKDYPNFITCDLICHGVSPQRYLKEEISKFKDKDKIGNITFRNNTKNNFCLVFWGKEYDSHKILRRTPFKEDYYFRGYLSGITLRENCYICKYARPERIADITLGDFIGLGDVEPFKYKAGNVSSITTNTEKGELFFNSVINANEEELNIVKRSYEERLRYKPSLLEAYPKNPLATKFRNLMKGYGYYAAIRMTLSRDIKQAQKVRRINMLLSPYTFAKRVIRKVKRINFHK